MVNILVRKKVNKFFQNQVQATLTVKFGLLYFYQREI